MLELNFTADDLIGTHADGSGLYRNYRVGEYLATAIGDGGKDDEFFAELLTRRPEWDPVDGVVTIEGETIDFEENLLSERFASEIGGRCYWIDGLAYTADYADDVYLMDAPPFTPAQ